MSRYDEGGVLVHGSVLVQGIDPPEYTLTRRQLAYLICRAYDVPPWVVGLEPRERPVDRARRLRIERAMRLRARRASRRSRKASR